MPTLNLKINVWRSLSIVIILFFIAPIPQSIGQSAIEQLTSSTKEEKTQSKSENEKNTQTKRDPNHESHEEAANRLNLRRDGKLKRHAIGFSIGQTFLNKDFKNNGTNGINPELYYSYSASHSFDVVVNLHVSKHKKQHRDNNTNSSSQISGLATGIKGRMFQFDLFSPFIIAGFGIYWPKIVYPNGNSSQTKLSFGHHLAGGGELELNERFMLSFLAHYHNPYDIQEDDGSKVRGSYIKFLTALTFII